MSTDKADPTIVSRRVVLGVPAAPVLAGAGADLAADDVVARSAAFLAVDAEIRRLSDRWGDLEARSAGPDLREMARIDAALGVLFEDRSHLLDGLSAAVVRDPRAAAAKLAVAARVICADTDPRMHRLLDGLARDLTALRCPHCRAVLVAETPAR